MPDVICNAGGVTVSYSSGCKTSAASSGAKTRSTCGSTRSWWEALGKIRDTADRHKISLRTATFAVACERVLQAREERGLYP